MNILESNALDKENISKLEVNDKIAITIELGAKALFISKHKIMLSRITDELMRLCPGRFYDISVDKENLLLTFVVASTTIIHTYEIKPISSDLKKYVVYIPHIALMDLKH